MCARLVHIPRCNADTHLNPSQLPNNTSLAVADTNSPDLAARSLFLQLLPQLADLARLSHVNSRSRASLFRHVWLIY